MKKTLHTLALLMIALLSCTLTVSAVSIQTTKGWFESGYVTWERETGATYTVYYRQQGGTYQKMDNELVRLYSDYGRADMVGLKAGNYQFKVVSSTSGEAESDIFYAAPHDRSGFAHIGMNDGIGAYCVDRDPHGCGRHAERQYAYIIPYGKNGEDRYARSEERRQRDAIYRHTSHTRGIRGRRRGPSALRAHSRHGESR